MYPGVLSAIEQMVWVKLSYRAANPQGISLVWVFIGKVHCPVICILITLRTESMKVLVLCKGQNSGFYWLIIPSWLKKC